VFNVSAIDGPKGEVCGLRSPMFLAQRSVYATSAVFSSVFNMSPRFLLTSFGEQNSACERIG